MEDIMKKFLAITLCLLMVLFAFAACGEEKTETKKDDTQDTTAEIETEPVTEEAQDTSAEAAEFDPATATGDLKDIIEKGTLIVGITEFEPMNYRDENDAWTGFDTEFAEAVAAKFGVDVEFREIEWDNKWIELESGNIDCVWNGMTITDEVTQNASCTNAYVINAQVVVMAADQLDTYKDVESMKDLTFAVESGSAGQEVGEACELNVVEYTAQSDAVMAVESGKADACIIDLTMANAMTGEGTSYADLGAGLALSSEEYGIAFRKDSTATDAVNTIIEVLKADGTLPQLAEKYQLTLAD